MFCVKCGKQLKDGAKFCRYCGAKVTIKVVTREEAQQGMGGAGTAGTGTAPGAAGNTPKSTESRTPKGPKSKDKEKKNSPQGNGRRAVIAATVLAAALVLAVILLFVFFPGLSLPFLSGEDTSSGQGDPEVEEEEEVAKTGEESPEDEEPDGEEDLEEEEPDEEESDEEDESILYNPFDHIEIVFSGTSPNGTASIDLTEDEEDTIAEFLLFSIDVSEGLSNGDTVTVSVSNNEEAFLESDGVILSPLEQEYTVEGLSWYISSMEEVEEEDLELMKETVESAFEQHVAADWITRLWSAPGFDYIGSCLLTPKEGEGNLLYLIYQVNAECFEETGDGFSDQIFTYYYYARTEDVLADGDGSIAVEDLDFVKPTDSYNLYETYNVFGYKTLDEMYDAILADDYDCEDLVEDQDFGYEPVQLDMIDTVPEDAVAYNGHYYKMYGVENMTWEQAKEQCEIRGGHLATITSEEEWEAISVYVFGDSGADFWIGGYYSGGSWQWVTGEEMSEIGWTNGVPDASDAAAYAYLGTSSWRWRNFTLEGIHADNYTVGYICEWE